MTGEGIMAPGADGATMLSQAVPPAASSSTVALDPHAPPQTPTAETPFYHEAAQAASASIDGIRRSLHRFPTPKLRIQRVNQLDAELLDRELSELLLDPVKKALGMIRSTLPADLEPELLLFLKLVLFKFSIYDRGASYGSMLQNLKYRNEWAHKGGLQSIARDQPLSKLQLSLYPLLTILFPYLGTKLQDRMTSFSYSEMPPNDIRRRLWSLTDFTQRIWATAVLANFAVFLNNGKYRSVADRLLGMRLTYAQRTMNRNVSFEFLNRQLVWHAFTEFLLFLLPLVKPRRLLRRLMRLPTHPRLLSLLLYILPMAVSSRLGLSRDAQGRARFDRKTIVLPGFGGNASEKGKQPDTEGRGRYWTLPAACCAICFEKVEKASGIHANPTQVGSGGLSMGIPTSDPLDPSSGLLAPNRSATTARGSGAQMRTLASSQSLGVSPDGLAYADALVHTPYRALPCGCTYCYYCLASKLLSEEIEEELEDEGGWECLRCRARIRQMERAIDTETETSEAELDEDEDAEDVEGDSEGSNEVEGAVMV
ncbi:peroxisome assembly protein (Peroxin-2) [Thecaphora frezii]